MARRAQNVIREYRHLSCVIPVRPKAETGTYTHGVTQLRPAQPFKGVVFMGSGLAASRQTGMTDDRWN